MSAIRRLAKLCIVLLLGSDSKPRRILRGLGSGYRICVSPAENLGYLLGTDEPHLQRAIRDYVSAGDTVYDIGANVGYVSLSLAKRVGSRGTVVAFEPLQRNVDLLRRNIQVNDLENIRLLDVAASDGCGEAVIRIAENPATASMLWHKNNPSATELIIRTAAIDDLVMRHEIGYPKFVKIDVEGSEGSVLRGMRRTIAVSKPILFIECSDTGREAAWSLLRELGYQCQSATTRKWVNNFEDYRHADFLWLPSTNMATTSDPNC
jgi:FkbM family methyltransferase